MPTLKLAFDRTARRIDADGRLHVDRSHISKAAVNPYYGSEIPGFKELGLDPAKVYRLFRDPIELERAAPTFARLPILSKHVPVTVATMLEDPEQKKLVVGAIGSEVIFAHPFLDADLCFWDGAAIAGIDTHDVEELSCAYRYVPVMEPGEFEGEAYDGRMTEIKGNHLALVEVGRAGSDVVVADQNPFTFKESAMKMTKLGAALFAALCAASPVLAADSALPALVGQANRKTFDKEAVKAKLLAMDGDLNPESTGNMLDALMDVEQSPVAKEPKAAIDESPTDKIRAMLAGKVDDAMIDAICGMIAPAAAVDGDMPDMVKKEDMTTAMDGLRAEMRDAEKARRDVLPVVGEVIGMDSAAAVYAFALDHMKVDHKDVEGVAALRALFTVASTKKPVEKAPNIAADAAGALQLFPALARFGVAS